MIADAAIQLVERRFAGQCEIQHVEPLAHFAAELLPE
jgi:hypothetical protein